jgi:hypothetical protein
MNEDSTYSIPVSLSFACLERRKAIGGAGAAGEEGSQSASCLLRFPFKQFPHEGSPLRISFIVYCSLNYVGVTFLRCTVQQRFYFVNFFLIVAFYVIQFTILMHFYSVHKFADISLFSARQVSMHSKPTI